MSETEQMDLCTMKGSGFNLKHKKNSKSLSIIFFGVLCSACILGSTATQFYPGKSSENKFMHQFDPQLSKSSIPDFCTNLIKNPAPCMLKGDSKFLCNREAGGDVMFSSDFQDYVLYTRHFRFMKRPGIYFDVAANHPIHGSNTFFLDRCLQWKGVCAEGNDIYFEPLYRERTCHLVPTCVSESDGQTVSFNLQVALGGIIDKNYKNSNQLKPNVPVKKLRCTSMKNISQKFGISRIDYLSLDVEGSELEILKGIDWNSTQIDIISIENGPRKKEISKYLESKGHHELKIIPTPQEANYDRFMKIDAIFVHQSIQIGAPK